MQRVIIIGPGHPLRGGLATFNHRLAREFIAEGNECSLVSFSLQYPSPAFSRHFAIIQMSLHPEGLGNFILFIISNQSFLNWV